MKTKINPTDTIFSRYIRTRDKWTCQKCGKQYEEGSRGLHCSHIFSRRHRTIRWDERNAKALCFSCHQWYGGNPSESGEWVRDYLGDNKYAGLVETKESRQKITKADEKEIKAYWKKKLEELNG